MVQVGEVRAYIQAAGVPMRVVEVNGQQVRARPVGINNARPITYDLGDFLRWYPVVLGEPVEVINTLFVSNPHATARLIA